MNSLGFRKWVLAGDKLIGTFLNTGSSVSAEIAGRSGLDWCLLDMEHGMGSWEGLLHQLMAIEGTGASPIVRVPGLDPAAFKKVLDSGAHGVMVPNVNTAEEAAQAVSYSRYPPHGVRGVSGMNRSAYFGKKLDKRIRSAHENTLVIVQVESPDAVKNADEIAAVDGVDALFIGPLDLSVSLGIPRQFSHPDFIDASDLVIEAARKHRKGSGILLGSGAEVADAYRRGFNLIAVGSDGSIIANGMDAIVQSKRDYTETAT